MNTYQNFSDHQNNRTNDQISDQTVNQYDQHTNDNSFIITQLMLKELYNKIAKKLASRNNKKGYMLLFMVFFFGMIGLGLLLEPLAVSSVAIYKTRFEIARRQNETINIAISSPVRKFIVDQMYANIQNLLIYHINAANGSAPYSCNGQTVQPTSIDPVGGALDQQFGLCSPETALYGLLGDTNQSINFLDTIYPNWRQPLEDKPLEGLRQTMIRKYQNNYSYSLRSTYVGKEVVSQGVNATGSSRVERYHWLVRSDVESKTYDDITGGMVVDYDVYLTNSYYPGNFYGGGSACDERTTPSTFCGQVDASGQPISCIPSMIQLSDGSWQFATDFNSGAGVSGKCKRVTVGNFETFECPLSDGSTRIDFLPRGTRPQTGCASLNTGIPGTTAPDSGGYGFELTVRIVSIGNPYN